MTELSALEVGKKLVELCKQGKAHEAIETLYDKDIVSVEAQSMPGMPAEMKGLGAVLQKSKWWGDNHVIHSAEATGPFPHGDRFCVRFVYDVTNKPSGQRHTMDEIGLYTVRGGKVVREEFFYGG